MILQTMNLAAHIDARLPNLQTMQELIQFMHNQGFHRESQTTWQAIKKPFTGHTLEIKRIQGYFEVVA